MLASFPASMLNQSRPDSGIPNRINLISPRSRRILGEYVEPGQRDATRTVERLLAVLDKNDVVHALDRTNGRRVLRLVD